MVARVHGRARFQLVGDALPGLHSLAQRVAVLVDCVLQKGDKCRGFGVGELKVHESYSGLLTNYGESEDGRADQVELTLKRSSMTLTPAKSTSRFQPVVATAISRRWRRRASSAARRCAPRLSGLQDPPMLGSRAELTKTVR